VPSLVRRVKTFLGRIDRRVFPPQESLDALLRAAIAPDCSSVLDVGCGQGGSLLRRVPLLPFSVGVDLHLPPEDPDVPRHSGYVEADILALDERFSPGTFDCVVALDVVEHLERPEGLRLLGSMERIAARRVIVLTPNGFLPQPPTPDNPHQEHISGWTVEDFTARGYRVLGVNGWKPLRGMYGLIRLEPVGFWLRVSILTQSFTERHPRQAFQLLAVKDVGDDTASRRPDSHSPQ